MLYVAIATRAFRRYSTYTLATLAGIFTNCIFGIISCFVFMEVWQQRPDAGGYDLTDALTYVWVGQAMLMTVAMFGGGSPDDLAARIRSGDVVIDFYRPVGLLGWYLAADLGRATYHLLTRGLGPALVGALLFDLRSPPGPWGWVAFLVAVVLAVLVSFALRMLVAITSFWLFDESGPRTVLVVMNSFFTGLTVPLVLFPGALRELAMALPWAAMLQVPADIWLGQRTGAEVWSGLGFGAAWALGLMIACLTMLRLAERRVVVQGG
ncbi:ABC-2 type transport system permease protein [Nocardioides daedukensis]|uniref:ABC-2 type transport system permease protein n=1 Tax=Nocardioides daedukensis TaxID=634462 RepID=A0A7Y9RYM3_9ACTN|nr:ABC-2 type transport system permease protein [Nocardioides daedukensis]